MSDTLSRAIQQHDVLQVHLLLRQPGILDSRIGDHTLLTYTCLSGFTYLLEVLLDKGIDPDELNNNGVSALYISAVYQHKECVRILLDAGTPPNVDSTFAINAAAYVDNMEIMEMLIDAGASANKQGNNLLTPLHYMTSFNNVEGVEMLLRAGADPSIAGIYYKKETPLEVAIRERNTACIDLMNEQIKKTQPQ